MKSPYSFPEFINESVAFPPVPMDPVEDALRQLRLVIQREQGPYLTDALREIISEARAPKSKAEAPAPNGHVKRRRSKASREAQAKKMRAYWKKRKKAKHG